jgi:hypothetical protein
MDALARIESGVPTPPRKLNGACSAELEAITLKAVDPDPSRRYPTVAQFADDLRRLQAGEAVSARRDGTWRAVGRWTRRHPFPTGVAATVSAATIAWAGWAWQQHQLRMHAATAMAAATVKVLDFADTRPGNVAIRQLLAETYLPVTEQLVSARPSDADAKLFLARLLETQASVILVGGDHAAGGELRRRVLSLYDELCAADPDSIELAHQRSIAIVRVGDVLMPSDAEQGGSMYREAMRIQQELVDRGAGDASLIDDLGWSYGRMARICLLQNEPLDAIAWLERQTDIALRVRAIDPAVPRSYWTDATTTIRGRCEIRWRRPSDWSRSRPTTGPRCSSTPDTPFASPAMSRCPRANFTAPLNLRVARGSRFFASRVGSPIRPQPGKSPSCLMRSCCNYGRPRSTYSPPDPTDRDRRT